jgi:hypothetical protein
VVLEAQGDLEDQVVLEDLEEKPLQVGLENLVVQTDLVVLEDLVGPEDLVGQVVL